MKHAKVWAWLTAGLPWSHRTGFLSGNNMRVVCGSECVRTQKSIRGVSSASLGWIRHPWRSYRTHTYRKGSQAGYTYQLNLVTSVQNDEMTCSSEFCTEPARARSCLNMKAYTCMWLLHAHKHTQILHMFGFCLTSPCLRSHTRILNAETREHPVGDGCLAHSDWFHSMKNGWD